MKYVDLAFPTAPTAFTYATDFDVQAGDLVVAPLRNSVVNGVVIAVHTNKPNYQTKSTKELIRKAVLTDWQVKTALWINQYYHAHLGKTLRLWLPERVWNDTPLKRKTKQVELKPVPQKKKQLNAAQATALKSILKSKKTCLLHGITGSGKTEVYLQAILKVLDAGKQAILLVPEIALTPQLVGYFAASIEAKKIAVIHSHLAEGARLATWERIKAGEVRLIIGSRSALFAPADNVGIIILDEEHEWTYKNDQSPRYHARTVATKMAELTGAKLVLGSATPSLESYAAAQARRIQLLELPKRIDDVPLPPVEIVNLTNELKKQNYSIFSERLTEEIQKRLKKKEQVVLLLNKRGYSTSIVCRDCGEALECVNCSVPLTFHQFNNRCLCHLCGHFEPIPSACPACGSLRIKQLGTGTQKLESELAQICPTAKVLRADKDTTTTRGSHQAIYEKFRSGEADILVGTQIVAKGLDLPNVTLVGVLLADVGLHLPDFRAAEKTFCLLTQVAGRAGRASKTGEVIIQTYSPQHPAIRAAARHDYATFAAAELKERQEFGYPPFGQIVKFAFVNVSESKARRSAIALAEQIKQTKTGRVHATPALISKIHNKYHWHVIWQGRDPSLLWQNIEIPEGCRVDVDPVQVV